MLDTISNIKMQLPLYCYHSKKIIPGLFVQYTQTLIVPLNSLYAMHFVSFISFMLPRMPINCIWNIDTCNL